MWPSVENVSPTLVYPKEPTPNLQERLFENILIQCLLPDNDYDNKCELKCTEYFT